MSEKRAELNRIRSNKAALVSALREAGAAVNGRAAIRCPFHKDEHASAGIHEHGGCWYFTCHGCQWNGDRRTGDVLDVVQKMHDLDFHGAAERLGLRLGSGEGEGGKAVSRRATPRNGARDRADCGEERHAAGSDSGADVAALAREATERLIADAAAQARLWSTRAIDRATAERFKLGVTADGGYWTLPVTSTSGRLMAVKYHRADAKTDAPKCYWTPRGASARNVWPLHLDADGPVWLCPGELKALALIALGRCAVGVTGGEAAPLPECLPELLSGRAVAIVGDDDDAGRRWARAARDTLAEHGIEARIVDLSLDKGRGLKDVGDLIVRRRVIEKLPDETVANLLDRAYERSDPWRTFTLGGIWAEAATWRPTEHVLTGLRSLDARLGGGLRVGGVHLLAGKTGRAKTQTAVQCALNAALAGVPVGVVSLELPRRDLAHLIVSNLAAIPRRWIADDSLDLAQHARLDGVRREHAGLPLTLLDAEYWGGALNRTRLCAIVGDGCRLFGWRLVLLDYIGLLAAAPGDTSEYGADCENSAALKRLAQTCNIALLVIADLRKSGTQKGADREPTSIDEIRGAGRIAYDAVNVFAVDCEQVEADAGTRATGLVKVRALKTRYSGLGSAGEELHFKWWPAIGRVEDLDTANGGPGGRER
ncbi:MAG: hypothetical protein HRF50_05215 [Phycisphaerae bacterium]|jgi:hypothetical protein